MRPPDDGGGGEGRLPDSLSPEFRTIAEGFGRRDPRSLARAISMVWNRVPGSEDLMEVLSVAGPQGAVRIGFTGPPGVVVLMQSLADHSGVA